MPSRVAVRVFAVLALPRRLHLFSELTQDLRPGLNYVALSGLMFSRLGFSRFRRVAHLCIAMGRTSGSACLCVCGYAS